MTLNITLDDAAINAMRDTAAPQQKVQQASDMVFLSVDLSSEITLGLAILTAVAASAAIHAELGDKPEKEILRAITSIAFRYPTEAVAVQTVQGDTTNAGVMPASELSYLPAARLWRNYVTGGATAVILDIGIEL